ncbi:MAG: propionate--CoA ligase [Proteobacteria bacterium]|nr:propionate--CoA ligase [Pseudomonadota bacterium]
MQNYKEFYKKSMEDRDGFWREQARLITWKKDFDSVLDYKNPPFARWFVGGTTNLCFNAVDRHLKDKANQRALIYISTETGEEKEYTFQQMYSEINSCALMLSDLGVSKGDRVIVYMPMIPEAIFSVLACARIGAIHCIVFGGFAAESLAKRIEDSSPKVIITADAGMRAGRVIPYKPLVDQAIEISSKKPEKVVLYTRDLFSDFDFDSSRDFYYQKNIKNYYGRSIDPVWLESSEPSYISYTSGTTGPPKGVQRDTGGHGVALAASMKHIYCGKSGETMFTTSDIGWVVGHSYIIYGPLLAGMTTIVYEGLPNRPSPGIWWEIVEKYKVDVMFSSPTAIRVLKKESQSFIEKNDISSLKHLFLAGEPLDEPSHRWASDALKIPVIDHFWQTETGWPMLTSFPGIEKTPIKFGSPSFPAYGYDLKILSEVTEEEVDVGEKGVVAVVPPLPPGCMTTVWGNDKRFVETYFKDFKSALIYSTFDWGIKDHEGYYFILGRTDDVINVAGHRIGTREIEEALQSHQNVAEVAVVGVEDSVKGQIPVAFIVLKKSEFSAAKSQLDQEADTIAKSVANKLGAIARPKKIYFVNMLPKTRSGKLLRRSIQALAEGRQPGDLSTLEDPSALEEIAKILS